MDKNQNQMTVQQDGSNMGQQPFIVPPPMGYPRVSASMLEHAMHQYHQHSQNQLHLHHQQQIQAFWQNAYQEIETTSFPVKVHMLPLARIKRIMKADKDVKMISAEAPILFAKACELFVMELSLRAWAHTEENKRRTLQRNDIAMAITKTDCFDFLIDIVLRERDDIKIMKKMSDEALARQTPLPPEQMQYFYQLAQQSHGQHEGQPQAVNVPQRQQENYMYSSGSYRPYSLPSMPPTTQ